MRQGKLECSWQHVPRSSNARADLLANIAIDTKSEGEVFDPSTNIEPATPIKAAGAPPPAAAPALSSTPPSPLVSVLPGIVGGGSPAATSSSSSSTLPFSSADVASSSTARGTGVTATGGVGTASDGTTPVAVSTVRGGVAGASSSAEAREAAAVAAAVAAYAAVTASVRATIASGGLGDGRGGAEIGAFGAVAPGLDALGSRSGLRASSAEVGLLPVAGGERGGALVQQPKRRFMVHVASWRKAEASPRAMAAVLYEEGSWRRLKVGWGLVVL